MHAPTERPIPAALAPWVVVLVALIGLNAITQDHSRGRRSDSTGKAEISQPADVLVAAGNFAGPLVFLIPHSAYHAATPVSGLLGVEISHEEPLSEFPQGGVRGRAPPAGLLS
jgi:hypothetical protein